MGSLAKYGIAFGKKISTSSVTGLRLELAHGRFVKKSLSHFGFEHIAEKLLDQKSLELADIVELLDHAPLPVLIKLIELKGGTAEIVPPVPSVFLPLSRWLHDGSYEKATAQSKQFLRAITHENVRVVIDRIDLTKLDSGLLDAIHEISHCRSGITLVGPQIKEIIAAVGVSSTARSREVSWLSLSALLSKLQQAGLTRLRGSHAIGELKEIELREAHEAGFPNTLITRLDAFASATDLAHELLDISAMSREKGFVEVWTPGLSFTKNSKTPGAHHWDLHLLRALAVAAIFLDKVPFKRASSRYFSLDAIGFARYCGANDFGYGAIDELTAQTIHIEPIEKLHGITAQV